MNPPKTLLERCERERDGYRHEAHDARRRIRGALLHYQIGEEASRLFAAEQAGQVVSWRYVAECMAKALRGEEETPPVAPRDYTREPEDDDGDPETTARLWDGH